MASSTDSLILQVFPHDPLLWLGCLTDLTASAADTTVYKDAETGFTFSQYSAAYSLAGKYITYRIAVPSNATSAEVYDTVVQVVCPNDVGWLGLAWGGSMLNNPLLVAWSSNGKPIVSSRFTQYVESQVDHTSLESPLLLTTGPHRNRNMPQTYSGTQYQIFKTGTKSNSTHWQFTAKCNGCTTYRLSSGSTKVLNPKGSNHLAFAYAASKPANPSSNSSSFQVHDVYNYWSHDFSQGENSAFTTLVAKNSGLSQRLSRERAFIQ